MAPQPAKYPKFILPFTNILTKVIWNLRRDYWVVRTVVSPVSRFSSPVLSNSSRSTLLTSMCQIWITTKMETQSFTVERREERPCGIIHPRPWPEVHFGSCRLGSHQRPRFARLGNRPHYEYEPAYSRQWSNVHSRRRFGVRTVCKQANSF